MNTPEFDRYAPPSTPAEEQPSRDADGYLGEPQSVGPGHALVWLRNVWRLFKQQPIKWLGASLLILLANFVIILLPFIGMLLQPLFMMVILAGIAYAAQSLEQRGNFGIGDIFLTGFWKNGKSLLGAGLFSLALSFLYGIAIFILLGNDGLDGLEAFAYSRQNDMPAGMNALNIGFFVVYLALTFLVPTLIILQNEKLFRAVGLSCKGFLRNIVGAILCALYVGLAFCGTIFSTVFLIGLLSSLSASSGMGWLVVLLVILIMLAFLPILFLLPYAVYRDLFFKEE
ncbi:BPSS1780 family membrane protein [Eikenella sp. Marseille-P7795]|uniref:BPSS1780 family membrane protein n=1 Tax=Eikenella sp. Marseille-P7795 TaxID=2866577 RepID=UPI001CE4654D|nr:BPSS1780 family membrane protein [Eikenella sp. Marseille-P7795]